MCVCMCVCVCVCVSRYANRMFSVRADSDERLLYDCFIVATGLRVRLKYGRSIGSSLVLRIKVETDCDLDPQ